jgi:hypothetical protein
LNSFSHFFWQFVHFLSLRKYVLCIEGVMGKEVTHRQTLNSGKGAMMVSIQKPDASVPQSLYRYSLLRPIFFLLVMARVG